MYPRGRRGAEEAYIFVVYLRHLTIDNSSGGGGVDFGMYSEKNNEKTKKNMRQAGTLRVCRQVYRVHASRV